MRWTILICSMPDSYSTGKLKRLMDELYVQTSKFPGQVDCIGDSTGPHMPTGTKRNLLIQKCQTEYFSFLDCDDMIAPSYVSDILTAISSNPDCVTFKGWMTTNGINRREWTIKLGSGYYEKDGHYYRWPNHLAVMKKSLIQNIPFPPIWQQEDYQWSKQINDKKILKTEVHIDRPIYHYDYWDKDKRHNHQTIKNIRR